MNAKVDRRQFGRRQVHVPGWIVVAGRPRLACHVINYSPKGAFLKVEPPGWLPFRFQLKLEGSGAVVICEIRHVGTEGIGVNFSDQSVDGSLGGLSMFEADVDAWLGRAASPQRRARKAP